MMDLFSHEDVLAELRTAIPAPRKLEIIHQALRKPFPFIDRIAIASYDTKTGLLKTYLSTGPESPLVGYEFPLSEAASLREIRDKDRPRVVDDLRLFRFGIHRHTQAVRQAGFGSSYTVPLHLHGAFWGFLFFNSFKTGAFVEEALDTLDVYGHLIAHVVFLEFVSMRVLAAATRTAHDMVHSRDPETGHHLDRMAEYSRVIAHDLAAGGNPAINDAYIEKIFLFAPLHDVGKIGIPDRVLQKPGRLTGPEEAIMQMHARKGGLIIDAIAANFGLESSESVDMLRNIALRHHEKLDGSGYPDGLKGAEIPLEARIIAVADIFDALTSRRVYKEPWSNDDAAATLLTLARTQLDAECVQALLRNLPRVAAIQDQFPD